MLFWKYNWSFYLKCSLLGATKQFLIGSPPLGEQNILYKIERYIFRIITWRWRQESLKTNDVIVFSHFKKWFCIYLSSHLRIEKVFWISVPATFERSHFNCLYLYSAYAAHYSVYLLLLRSISDRYQVVLVRSHSDHSWVKSISGPIQHTSDLRFLASPPSCSNKDIPTHSHRRWKHC